MKTRSRLLALPLLAVGALLACRSTSFSPGVQSPFVTAESQARRTAPYDVEHYSLDLTIDPERRRFAGTCTISLSATEPLERVELDLVGLDVSDVKDSEGRPYYHRHADGVLAVPLTSALREGERISLVVTYSGSPRKGLWFAGDESGTPTHVFTQGECEGARFWFPCFDAPHERATSDLRVTMPGEWVSVAAGELVEDEALEDGRRVQHWRMEQTHPSYLLTLVAGELEVLHSEWRGLPLSFYARAQFAHLMEPAFEETAPALEFLTELTGHMYPYPKYAQACVHNFPFGGMENISASTLTETTLTDERGRRDRSSVGLVVHEAAHQWFGDLLTCAEWSEIWLNEGFATYLTMMYFEQTRGREAFAERVHASLDTYLDGDRGAGRRPIVHDVYKDPLDLFFGGHAYQGGASRLHLLRFVLGDEAFTAGIRRYVARNVESGVTTDDLREAFEEASGQDLSVFFQQWLHEPGYPELRIKWEHDERNGFVLVTVEQTQEPSQGTPAVFRTPVAIELMTGSGADVQRVELTRRRETFRFRSLERPRWVRFDKGGWLPARIESVKSVGEWLAILQDDDDLFGRMAALDALGRQLGEEGRDARRGIVMEAVIDALVEDSSLAVRERAAEVLAGEEAPEAVHALRVAAEGDTEARVRAAALRGLAVQGPDEALASFGREQFAVGFSWDTMAAASELVVHADPDGALAFLTAGMEQESPHGNLRARLVSLLPAVGGDEALALARRMLADRTQPSGVRTAAATAVGDLGAGTSEARDALLEQLGSRDFRLRMSTLEALKSWEDTYVERRLREFYEDSVFPRERRVIETALRRATVGVDV